jgi:hypothetical protein
MEVLLRESGKPTRGVRRRTRSGMVPAPPRATDREPWLGAGRISGVLTHDRKNDRYEMRWLPGEAL